MFTRLRPHSLSPSYTRRLISTPSSLSTRNALKYSRILAGCTALGLVGAVALVSTGNSDEESMGTLIRTYSVYRVCSFPSLIDIAPGTLSVVMKIPIVNWIAEAVVRVTFFEQVSALTLLVSCFGLQLLTAIL